jgi:hypothetical protein
MLQMAKISRFLLLSLALLSISPVVQARRSFQAVVDDTVIASKLRFAYMKDGMVDARDITIKVLSGVVTLEGYVANQDQINRAIELAEKEKGVSEVKAYLVLREFGRLREENDHSSHDGLFHIFHSSGSPKTAKTKKSNKDDLQELDLSDTGNDTASDTKEKSADKPVVDQTEKTTPDNDVEPKTAVTTPPQTPPSTPVKKSSDTPTTSATKDDGDDFKEFGGY